jgi:hypothetical protein
LNDREIDNLLKGAPIPPGPDPPGQVPSGPSAETLDRIAQSITGSITGSLQPVRPISPPWMLASAVALICAVVALAGAAALGFAGIAKMSALERAAVFSVLLILVLASASELVSAMIPGSRRRLSSGGLLTVAGLGLAAVLALCFRDYHTTRFIHAGLVCLAIGLLHAIPAGLLSWLVLRRGFAVDALSAGMAAGTLAGLAGVGMLELHCPNFQAAHVLVWHLGVLLASAALGALCGWRSSATFGQSADRRRRR